MILSDVPWADLFERVPNSGIRVRCKICHLSGQPGSPSSHRQFWGHRHFAGHPFRCKACDKHFTTSTGAASHCRQTQDAAHALARRLPDTPYEPDTKTNKELLT